MGDEVHGQHGGPGRRRTASDGTDGTDGTDEGTYRSGDGTWSAAPVWTSRLGALRNVVRQELVARQVAELAGPNPGRALDVGAGQGTQAIRLARHGWEVEAREPDPGMRAACAGALEAEPIDVRDLVDVVAGGLEELADLPPAGMDLVLCHGVFMYLDEVEVPLAALARHVAPGGLVSLVARNAAALAFRPARRGDWSQAQELLAATEPEPHGAVRPRSTNELGVDCWADEVDHLSEVLAAHGLGEARWYGVRVAVDGMAPTTPVPAEPDDLDHLLDVEEELGRRDPYRRVAPLFHLVMRRPT